MADIVTLRLNLDFRRVYARGKAVTAPALVVYYMRNRAGICRIGITASKKTGNAVQRNRARRIIREGVRGVLPLVSGSCGYDFVFVARSRTKQLKSTDITRVALAALKKEGLIPADAKSAD